MANRHNDDDDATESIELPRPVIPGRATLKETTDPVEPMATTSPPSHPSALDDATAPLRPNVAPSGRAPWAPLVARLQESGQMPVDADDATVIRSNNSNPSAPPVALGGRPASPPAAPPPPPPRPPPPPPPSPSARAQAEVEASLMRPSAPPPPTGFAAPPRTAGGGAGAPAGVRPLGQAVDVEPVPENVGRYRIIKRLNSGEASDVLLGQSAGPGGFSKWVVIKRVLPHLVDDDRAVDMFLREARIAARMNHSSIVQTYELGEDVPRQGGRGYFIAMEYIDGLSLSDIAQKTWAQGKSLPFEVIVSTLSDVALGLQYAHNLSDDDGELFGLVHRDVCPDNILVTKTGEAKLVDFGVATMANLTRFTRDGELRIKIPYTAPEQLKSEELDGRADLYSLGVSLYFLSTGVLPFTGKTSMQLMQQVTTQMPPPPSSHNASVPKSIDAIVMKLLAKKPAERFANGEEVYEALIDAVPSGKHDVVGFWSDVVSPFAAPRTNPGALPKPGVPAARLRKQMIAR